LAFPGEYENPVSFLWMYDSILTHFSMSNQIVIAINSYDSVKNILNVTLQTGSSSRLGNAIYYSMQINPNVDAVLPPKGFRVMQQISELSNALLQSAPVEAARNSFIAQSIRAFANDKLFQSHSFEFNSGTMTFPVGLSFLLPVFVLSLVREKENKILVMMKMHGLSTFAYYVTQYLHFFAIQSVCSLVFVLSGLAFQLPFFTQTDPGVYIVTLLIWANTLIALAFILSLFFRKTRTAIGKFSYLCAN
jgi:hypothetical protein